ncbi:MAG: transcription initiation factor IIB [Faunusvirus sp.]|jgi:transcription initiation factor TFIIB|uniref:Transcription initiation factor IIB n=1 Tax=Faunusvirus sp. TaxID=2487766 RepID=A0A3G4ZX44_9VIRU|nr:MAG: transcription initiation factor IIB [Faunusvirus sp.]
MSVTTLKFEQLDRNNSTKTAINHQYDSMWDDILPNLPNNAPSIKSVKKNTCPNCKLDTLISKSHKGCSECTNCGATIYDQLDRTPDWSSFDDGKGSARCGGPINFLLPKSSLGTSIGGNNSKIKKLQSWGQMPYKERRLYEVFQDIDHRCKRHNFPKSIIDNAKIFYKRIKECKHSNGEHKGKYIINRGLNESGIIAACAYFGAKKQKYPRTPKEISVIFDLTPEEVRFGCKKYLEIMEIDENSLCDIIPTIASDYIERYANKLKVAKQYIQIAVKVADNINKLDLSSDHQTISVAASCILIVSNVYELGLSKKMVAAAFDISDVTLSKTHKNLVKYEKILVSDELMEKVLKKIDHLKIR